MQMQGNVSSQNFTLIYFYTITEKLSAFIVSKINKEVIKFFLILKIKRVIKPYPK
jgi:hypothetical protein